MNRKGKVLFIVHEVYQEDNQFPLGVAYLASVLRNVGAEVTDCCQDVYHYSDQEVADKLLKNNKYDMIGIGFLGARFKETVVGLCEVVGQ